MKYFITLIWLAWLTATPALALKTVTMPDKLQTTQTKPIERTFYLKLPLKQVDQDWVFEDKRAVLAGTLLLRIARQNETNEIVIFNNGQLSPDWQPMPSAEPIFPTSMYFGFMSDKKYLTAPGDVIELIWHVPEPLEGIGAEFTATLPAGTYRSTGQYSGLTDNMDVTQTLLYRRVLRSINNGQKSRNKEELLEIFTQELNKLYDDTAFLHHWNEQWKMEVTSNAGWNRIGNIER